MSAQEGLMLRVTHLGITTQRIHLHDIIWGGGGGGDPYYRSPGPTYVRTNESVLLDYTSAVALSFEVGVIRGFLGRGYISAEFFFGPTFHSALVIGVLPPGDLLPTSFDAANNVVVQTDITGLTFDNTVTRSFRVLISVTIDAAADLFAVYTLNGIQKNASWDLSTTVTGDATGFLFFITNVGQIQYTSANSAGWVSTVVAFRAITTSV